MAWSIRQARRSSASGITTTSRSTCEKGDEMGRFLLGSTVVMLFPRGAIEFVADWAPARPVRMGEAMGAAASESVGEAAGATTG